MLKDIFLFLRMRKQYGSFENYLRSREVEKQIAELEWVFPWEHEEEQYDNDVLTSI